MTNRKNTTIKAGDTIRLERTLNKETGGKTQPIDLTDRTVQVYVQFEDEQLVANEEVTYEDRANGEVSVTLDGNQTSNIGTYRIEWVIDPGGSRTSRPKEGHDRIKTTSPLDRNLDPSQDLPADLTVTNLTVEGAVQADVDMGGNAVRNSSLVETSALEAGDVDVKKRVDITETASVGSGKSFLQLADGPLVGDKIENTIHFAEVGTSVVNLINGADISFPRAGLVLVAGTKSDDSATTFVDLLLVANIGDVQVVSSTARNDPDGRTYQENRVLDIAMDANEYDVSARLWGIGT